MATIAGAEGVGPLQRHDVNEGPPEHRAANRREELADREVRGVDHDALV
jgi:hypothetical protein